MSPHLVPRSRPQLGRHRAEEMLHTLGVDIMRPAILGVRSYYRDTMGKPGVGDRGLYDDAIIIVTTHVFAAFNANTDPTGFGGHLAVLQAGVYSYRLGIHHPNSPNAYQCLVQAGPVTVKRDNGVVESGEFYIHIHKGSLTSTSSAGCQTIPPSQWPAFLELAKSEMLRYGVGLPLEKLVIPYALAEYDAP